MLLIKNYLNMDKHNTPATNLQKRPPTKPFDMELIKTLIAERLPLKRDAIGDDISLIGADSIDLIDLLLALEDKLGCLIPIEDAAKFTTPKAIYHYLSEM